MGKTRKETLDREIDLVARNVGELIEGAEGHLSVEDAVQHIGAAGFKELTKGTREGILGEVARFITRNMLPKEVQENLVMASANQALTSALQRGNPMDIGFAVDRLAKLTGMDKKPVEINLNLGELSDLLATAREEKFSVIDIVAEPQKEG